MTDLIIDPQIRTWVFLPIVILTFLAGVFRHYLTMLVKMDKPVELEKIRDSQILIRMQLLRKNGQYINDGAFLVRKNSFIREYSDYIKEDVAPISEFYAMAEDTNLLKETFVNNLINYLPMVMIGSWLMYQLSGFLLTKIPIPLTFRFKTMLQKDIFLNDLEADWVSSASWYFLNICGLRSIYFMILGENNCAEQTVDYHNYAAALPVNINSFFKNEVEALIICNQECIVNSDIHY